jgi:hypothetical protein
MPSVDPSQFIRTLKLIMTWSAASNASPEEIRHASEVLSANRVQIEREIEDCIDDGLRGKGFDDTNTRVRISPEMTALHMALTIQVTFASLVQETSERIMAVATKVDECAGSVLRARVQRQGARVTEQARQIRLDKTIPNKEVMTDPAPPAKKDMPARNTALENRVQQITAWVGINAALAVFTLAGVIVLLFLVFTRR